jgi:hypothetical protein
MRNDNRVEHPPGGARRMKYLRYVPHALVPSYLALGWMFADRYRNPYSVIMCWPCACKMVVPL